MRPMRRRTEAPRAERGEHAQAIGRTRGGRTSKIHAAANQAGKPIAFHLSGGNTADLRGGETPIEAVPRGRPGDR
jgi:hypothetical protein